MGARHADDLRSVESDVAAHSAAFKKELGLRDLALTQILFIIDVKSNFAFTFKITAGIIAANIVGAGIFAAARTKRGRSQ